MIVILAVVLGVLYLTPDDSPKSHAVISVAGAMAASDTAGFARADKPKRFEFPREFGPHTEFKTEWWYFTGNLHAENGRHFGFQLTFFRSAVSPGIVAGTSKWRTNQIYMAHFAVTDVENSEFHNFERFSRGAAQLAGAEAAPFRVWLEDWVVHETGGEVRFDVPQLALEASDSGIALRLALVNEKPIVLQGNNGLSKKGPEPGNASYYYSLPRLRATGSIRIADEEHLVSGLAWLDREWSTSALGAGQIGWDWFALQLADRTELMFYQIRDVDGTTDELSQGLFVNSRGETVRLDNTQVELEVIEWWRSARGVRYPSRWRTKIPVLGVELEISPLLPDQELQHSFQYWEGAVEVSGHAAGVPVSGFGYVELTGYSESREDFRR